MSDAHETSPQRWIRRPIFSPNQLLTADQLLDGEGDRRRQGVFGHEAGIDALEPNEARREQAGTDEEYEREGDLGADEQAASGGSRHATSRARAARREHRRERSATRMDRGGNAEERAGDERAGGRGKQHAPVDGDVVGARQLARYESEHHTRRQRRNGHSAHRAKCGEEHVLDHQLAGETRPTSA